MMWSLRRSRWGIPRYRIELGVKACNKILLQDMRWWEKGEVWDRRSFAVFVIISLVAVVASFVIVIVIVADARADTFVVGLDVLRFVQCGSRESIHLRCALDDHIEPRIRAIIRVVIGGRASPALVAALNAEFDLSHWMQAAVR